MNKLLIAAFAASVAMTAQADALDLQSRASLRRHIMEQKNAEKSGPMRLINKKAGNAEATAAKETLAFVTLAADASTADLEAAGVEILVDREGVLLIKLPYDRVEELSALPCVKRLQLQKNLRSHTDLARATA